MNIPTIETERLILRPFQDFDLGAYSEMYSDEQFTDFLGGKTLSTKETWENMAVINGHWMLRGYGIWALEHKETGTLLGRVGLLNLPGWPGIEICWALSPKYWGNGFATEAASKAKDWAFNHLKENCFISLIDPRNHKSIAVATRIGEQFSEEINFKGKVMHVYEVKRNS